MNKKKFLIIPLATLVWLAGCATVPITGRKQLSFIPQQQLMTLSRDNYAQILKEANLSRDQASVATVRRVGERLVAAVERFMRENGMADRIAEYQWEFNLIDDDKTANAFCLPGGKVGVYTGLLPITRDEAGLAAVLAHEIAHAIANHGGERMSQQLIVQLGGLTLSQALKSKPAATRQIWGTAYGLGTTFGALLPYSRRHENEADHIGLIIMAMAGYDPHAAVALWERMSQADKSRVPELLSTHPAPATRIQRLKAELPEAMGYYK